MSRVWLIGPMVIIGILYTALLHFMTMPVFNNILVHCIIFGAAFGLINFGAVNLFLKKIDKLKELNNQLSSSLIIDKLTGVFNRRAFDNDIKNVGHDCRYSLIFIDIDNFRDFNNHFGHNIGDDVLRKVGQTIKNCVRSTDRVYRYGGEEIVLLLMDCDKKNARKMAEKIRSE